MTKTVALSDEAYHLLDAIRTEDESFTMAVIRLVNERRKPLLELKGIWKDDKETEAIFKRILSDRKKHTLREVRI